MKTYPIIFSLPMVRALLEGRKTQTRRIFKGTTERKGPYSAAYLERWEGHEGWAQICPYGKRGDLLWVRENFNIFTIAPKGLGVSLDKIPKVWPIQNAGILYAEVCHEDNKMRPSIHMPRWASRITLEIIKIRVEKLQTISDADKEAEGGTITAPFGDVWRRINTKPGIRWEDNPWVWVIDFKVHKINIDQFLTTTKE